jgi:DtxR family Mn-dependent transcriptional regulator
LLTATQKKYLFAIYIHGCDGKPVRLTSVAQTLGVAKASAVKMTRRLTEDGYIVKEPYREIMLTAEGIKAANELYTSHVILKNFLQGAVGISEEKADADSVTIISRFSSEGLEKLVGYALSQGTTE